MKEKEESKALSIPTELYQKIEKRAKDTGFGSVEEYVAFVLEEMLKEDVIADKEDEEEVKKRLRALGYLG